MNTVVTELKQARDLVQEAERILDNMPVDTDFDDQISDMANDAAALATNLDDLADEIERRFKK